MNGLPDAKPLDFFTCAYCEGGTVNLVPPDSRGKLYQCDKCGLTMSERKLEAAHVARGLAN